MTHRDLPGGPVVKNLPSNAGDAGSVPGQGTKIPHGVQQLSRYASARAHMPQTTEPTRSGTHAPQPEREKTCTPQLERSPRTTEASPHT